MSDKPLFIPLKTEHYDRFEKRIKKYELRPYGPRWNENTVWKGRQVVLSKGYGKQNRLKGFVTDLYVCPVTQLPPEVLKVWRSVYADKYETAATISIRLEDCLDREDFAE